jgi:hypothetical protein
MLAVYIFSHNNNGWQHPIAHRFEPGPSANLFIH